MNYEDQEIKNAINKFGGHGVYISKMMYFDKNNNLKTEYIIRWRDNSAVFAADSLEALTIHAQNYLEDEDYWRLYLGGV